MLPLQVVLTAAATAALTNRHAHLQLSLSNIIGEFSRTKNLNSEQFSPLSATSAISLRDAQQRPQLPKTIRAMVEFSRRSRSLQHRIIRGDATVGCLAHDGSLARASVSGPATNENPQVRPGRAVAAAVLL